MKQVPRTLYSLRWFFFGLLSLALSLPLAAQDVIVSQAIPDNAPQGTVNLNVTIKGKGFKRGAVAKWFVTGTTNPGGVTVNSTAFVSSSELLANITIANDAQTEMKFDIEVMLTTGRTGKGIELFSVTKKETTACTAPTPILAAPWSCLVQGGAGCQDTTFGSNGLVVTNTSGSSPTTTDIDIAKDVAIQSDGKLVVVGGSEIEGAPAGTNGFALVRYNLDGTLDTTFGGTGIVKLRHPTFFTAWAQTVAIQADGKIVVAGDVSLVARYNPDGTLDAGFGDGGSALVTFPSGRKGKPGQLVNAYYHDIAIQSDGKIVLVANTDWNGWALARLNPDGTLDASFGNGGRLLPSVNGGSVATVALQRVQVGEAIEEWILAGGSLLPTSWPNEDNDFAIMRLTPTGNLDTTFGPSATGMALTDFCGSTDHVEGLALDAAGNILAGGVSYVGSSSHFAMARYSANGTLDTSYGDPDSGTNQPGRTIVSVMAGESGPHGVLVQPDGKAIVPGTAKEAASRPYFGLVRFNPDGTLDTAFGYGGAVVTDFGPGQYGSEGYEGAVQSDGKIVVVGTVDANGTGYNFGVARYWP